jgi:hypothetical protein
MRKILVATKNRERHWEIAGARKKHSWSQYDSVMGIGEVLRNYWRSS